MRKRHYSHRERPIDRLVLCLLFRSNRRNYRHRRGVLGPFLRWLFGIQPRRSNYQQNQYYAPSRRRSTSSTTRTRTQPRTQPRAQSRSRYAQAADQPPLTIAERRAQEYRQSVQGQGRSTTSPSSTPKPRPPRAANQRNFHEKRPSERGVQSNLELRSHGNQSYQPLPPPIGQPPYHLSLDNVLPPDQMTAIRNSGRILMHIAGDTGGVKAPESQQIVAMAMETHFNFPDVTLCPAFFYHLGDVVYYYGEPKEYYPQFYDAYVHYPAPIFAIPGNHDGDLTDGSPPSLTAFAENFCAATPHVTREAGETERDAMTQPNVYWTLEAPFVTFIGLYSNVPEGGRLDNDQISWFINELRTAPTDKALIVCVHHPPFSGDSHHSGSRYIADTLDNAFNETRRWPDMVFAAHVHNYQRFTREIAQRHIPYIVAGAGGYWHLHYMAKQPDGSKTPIPFKMPDGPLTLENYCDDRHGFLRLLVTPKAISGEYFACPRPQESWRGQAERIDGFVLDLQSHKLTKGTDLL